MFLKLTPGATDRSLRLEFRRIGTVFALNRGTRRPPKFTTSLRRALDPDCCRNAPERLSAELRRNSRAVKSVAGWIPLSSAVLGWRFGLDAIIGLIPGLGDAATTVQSLYFSGQPRLRRRSPSSGLNVAVDILGSLPLVGDVFDIW
jgi:hypothetical protein